MLKKEKGVSFFVNMLNIFFLFVISLFRFFFSFNLGGPFFLVRTLSQLSS